jgi:hypothetical protein
MHPGTGTKQKHVSHKNESVVQAFVEKQWRPALGLLLVEAINHRVPIAGAHVCEELPTA